MTQTDYEPVKPKLFSVGDYIQMSVAAVMVILGVFGAFFVEQFGGILASSGMAVVSAVYIAIFVLVYKLPDYRQRLKGLTTAHGIILYLSPKMRLLPFGTVEEWTLSVLQHWKKCMNWDIAEMRKVLKGIKIHMYDKEYLEISDRKVKGAAQGKSIWMATIPKKGSETTPFKIVKSLFRHELSHILVYKFSPNRHMDEEAHHELFRETKLGA